MKKLGTFGASLLVLVLIMALLWQTKRLSNANQKIESWRSTMERADFHCGYLLSQLRLSKSAMEHPPNKESLEAAQANVDIMIQDHEEFDLCFDKKPDWVDVKLPCIIDRSDKCRSEFVDRMLQALPDHKGQLPGEER